VLEQPAAASSRALASHRQGEAGPGRERRTVHPACRGNRECQRQRGAVALGVPDGGPAGSVAVSFREAVRDALQGARHPVRRTRGRLAVGGTSSSARQGSGLDLGVVQHSSPPPCRSSRFLVQSHREPGFKPVQRGGGCRPRARSGRAETIRSGRSEASSTPGRPRSAAPGPYRERMSIAPGKSALGVPERWPCRQKHSVTGSLRALLPGSPKFRELDLRQSFQIARARSRALPRSGVNHQSSSRGAPSGLALACGEQGSRPPGESALYLVHDGHDLR